MSRTIKKLKINNIKNMKLKRLGIFTLAFTMLIGGFFINTAEATISGGSVAGSSSADLVAGTSDADYDVSFDTDINDQGNSLTVTFPEGYTITNGDLGTSVVKNSGGTLAGKISINGADWTVNTVTGDLASRTITITVNAVDFGFGTGTAFKIVSGVQNPTTAGTTGTFSITNNTTGETAQTDIAGGYHYWRISNGNCFYSTTSWFGQWFSFNHSTSSNSS